MVGAILLSAATWANARSFEDKFGRVIEAELVSHTGADGPKVSILKGGKEMAVDVSLFATKDQKFIRDWMKKTPAKIDYAFRVEASKKVADTARVKGYYEKNKSADTGFEITVTNLTRQPVKGIKIEYKAFMKNYGDPSGSSFYTTRPEVLNVTDAVKVEQKMPYNRSAVINTKTLRIDSSRGSFGSSDFNDELLGVIVRVFDPQGNMVTEWRTPNRSFEKIPWNYGDKKGGSSKPVVKIR
jgi:hypothetical protein